MRQVSFYETAIGPMTIAEQDGALVRISFGKEEPEPGEEIWETSLLEKAAEQLREYFSGKRKDFSLPLAPYGTEFQQAVWQALREIPYGETRSYGQIAAAIGRPKACRAVGMANHRNPISIVIPCHRVVGSNGSLTGYASGVDIKESLLRLERGEGFHPPKK